MPPEKAQAVHSARLRELQEQFDVFLPACPPTFTLEIGCGHGHFLDAYAAAHPEEHCLGIDIIRDRLERAARKVKRVGSRNAAFLLTDAQMFLENLPEAHRIAKIFVLFPDPWPKRRHHKNRLINPDFLLLLARKCTKTAQIYFRTDHLPYFESACELLLADPQWQVIHESWPFETVTVFQARAESYHSCIAGLRSSL